MDWYALDKNYINYLKKFDNMVPNIEYIGKLKCFLGIVIQNESYKYFIPLTSYKKKFEEMSNNLDFIKIENNDKIFGALDINNMIPVPDNSYEKIEFNNLSKFRDFKDINEKRKYWRLLKKELSYLDIDLVNTNANRLYNYVIKYPSDDLSMRCCNFKLLEEKCNLYKKELITMN